MKKRICFVVAVPITAQVFLKDHIKALGAEYDIYLVANIQSDEEVNGLDIVEWKRIDIQRGIAILKDLNAVRCLKKYFREMKFDAVHSITPKAGLVTALAGRMAGIKHRIHIFTGQVWCTRKGLMRKMLKFIDRIIARLNNHILVDGKSQRDFLEREGVLKKGQAEVFAQGSISGVNSARFTPDVVFRKSIREDLAIKEDMVCYIFLGRLNHDKGIGELLDAYNRLAGETTKVFLLLVGYDEDNYEKRIGEFVNIKPGFNFHYYGSTSNPEKVLNAGDVFVLPTYREGFGTSVLEAACVGIPCICSDAYGVLDAYIVGETGLQCKVGSPNSLYECMKQMHDNPSMRKQMGAKSRERALRDFDGTELSRCWKQYYHGIFVDKKY